MVTLNFTCVCIRLIHNCYVMINAQVLYSPDIIYSGLNDGYEYD